MADRTIRGDSLITCNAAFIDCPTGIGSEGDYNLIGSRVSQSADQFINLQVPTATTSVGPPCPTGASLPCTSTAEVFIVLAGEYTYRWGVDGQAGEFIGRAGDIVSVPTHLQWHHQHGTQRELHVHGTGPGQHRRHLLGSEGRTRAEGYGLYLTVDNMLVDTAAGQALDREIELTGRCRSC